MYIYLTFNFLKGTCIVSYLNRNDAEQGVQIFQKMTYGTSILDCYHADEQRR